MGLVLASPAAKEDELLSKLLFAEHETFHLYSREGNSLFLPNTRTQVLANNIALARSETQSATGNGNGLCINWPDIMAGADKTTIALMVAHCFSDKGSLEASFIFSCIGNELKTARKLVTTIVEQLDQH
jgi:hypothetical protein